MGNGALHWTMRMHVRNRRAFESPRRHRRHRYLNIINPRFKTRLFGRHAADAMKWSGGARRLLVTSRTSPWAVPPPKVVFCKDAPGDTRSERLYCSSAERAVGTSQRRVFDRVRRRIRRDRLLRSLMGAWTSRSSRSTTPSQVGRNVGGSRKAPSVSTWP